MSNEHAQAAPRRAAAAERGGWGVEVSPRRFDRTGTVSAIVAEHQPSSGEALEASRPEVRTAGRILGMRGFGKANFLVLSDGASRLQVYVRADSLSERDLQIFK